MSRLQELVKASPNYQKRRRQAIYAASNLWYAHNILVNLLPEESSQSIGNNTAKNEKLTEPLFNEEMRRLASQER